MLAGKILIYFRAEIGDSIHEGFGGKAKKIFEPGAREQHVNIKKALHGARPQY